jgi:mannose-6-phosphate isomerase-like protein (cupin superfamily)
LLVELMENRRQPIGLVNGECLRNAHDSAQHIARNILHVILLPRHGSNPVNKIDIADKFRLFDEEWTPKIIAESNGQLVKVAKGSGELVWHSHEGEDELFIVFKGRLTIRMRDGDVELGPGEMFVVPKGVEHCPRAEPDTHFMMIEPASTAHTGSTQSDRTVATEDQVWI